MGERYPNYGQEPSKSAIYRGTNESKKFGIDRTYTDNSSYPVKTGKRHDDIDRFQYNGPSDRQPILEQLKQQAAQYASEVIKDPAYSDYNLDKLYKSIYDMSLEKLIGENHMTDQDFLNDRRYDEANPNDPNSGVRLRANRTRNVDIPMQNRSQYSSRGMARAYANGTNPIIQWLKDCLGMRGGTKKKMRGGKSKEEFIITVKEMLNTPKYEGIMEAFESDNCLLDKEKIQGFIDELNENGFEGMDATGEELFPESLGGKRGKKTRKAKRRPRKTRKSKRRTKRTRK